MALHPDCFKPWEPLPAKGTHVVLHYKDGHTVEGLIALVWLAMDTPVFNVTKYDGEQVQFFPEFEDGWSEMGVVARRRL